MSRSLRTAPLLPVAVILLAACASPATAPQGCQSSAECSASSRCVSGACVANSPPRASIALPPGALESNLLLAFDGSASADPDPGDAIAAHAWTFRAVAAGCAPPVVAGTDPTAVVRFACPGTFAVDLAVTDRLGATATATKEVTIAPYSGPAVLTLGPDVAVGHACASGPARCALTGPVSLSAVPTAAAPAALGYAWTVLPPPGVALDATRRVTFSPGADVASPSVAIETDGRAISGDWLFLVEARDGAGVVASGAIRVSVGNRAPVLTRTIPVPDHVFDGAALTAAGEVAFTVTDPDGDPLVDRTVEWHHVGDGPGGVFTGSVLPSGSVSFSIAVPYGAPADAQYLIGGPSLERSILFAVSDVNGARVSETWPIVVGNRPPAPLSAPTTATVEHRYDAAAGRYVADADVGTWIDPDGDPLFPSIATGSGVCPSYDVLASGHAVVHCSAAYPGAPQLGAILGMWPVTVGVGDPWASSAPGTAYVNVQNAAPRFAQTSVSRGVSCIQGGCCRKDVDGACVAWYETYPADTLGFGGVVVDDDGDPLNITVDGAPGASCYASGCSVVGAVPQRGPVCGNVAVSDTWTVQASDSVGSVTGTVTVTRRCL